MNSNITNGIVAALVALVVAFGVTAVHKPSLPAGVLVDAGAVQSFGATAASFASTVFSHLSNLQVNGNFNVVGIMGQGADGNTGTVLQTQVVPVSCSGTASTTQFDISNPFVATSTATLVYLTGTGIASSTTFSIGTTTLPSVAALTGLGYSGTLAVSAVAATSSQFSLISGQTTLLGSGQITAGTSVKTILVGPLENIAMFATSTTANYKLYSNAGLVCNGALKFEH